MTAQYAAVAEKISKFLDIVNNRSADEKMAVKPLMIQSLDTTARTLYRTTTGMINASTAKTVAIDLDTDISLD